MELPKDICEDIFEGIIENVFKSIFENTPETPSPRGRYPRELEDTTVEAVKLLKETALRGETTRQEDATKLKLTKLPKRERKAAQAAQGDAGGQEEPHSGHQHPKV